VITHAAVAMVVQCSTPAAHRPKDQIMDGQRLSHGKRPGRALSKARSMIDSNLRGKSNGCWRDGIVISNLTSVVLCSMIYRPSEIACEI